MPPYSGQMQVVESDRARALTLDSQTWEIQFLHSPSASPGLETPGQYAPKRYFRVAMIDDRNIREKKLSHYQNSGEELDGRIVELIEHLAKVSLPFPAADIFEYWLLDAKDKLPLAMIYSCIEEQQKKTFPERAEWTALPAAVMPIDRSDEEVDREYAPINYQVERLVAERAGFNAQAKWFVRQSSQDVTFPPLLLREDWQQQQDADLCQRYLQRQSPRLLMLHGLDQQQRKQLEIHARHHALEVERFYKLYPEVVDTALIDSIRVEARLRGITEGQPDLHKRRDGILYL
jgi:hypothetical protein